MRQEVLGREYRMNYVVVRISRPSDKTQKLSNSGNEQDRE